jgi:macrolide-specific efflux system membrane fusion protein
VTRILPVLTTSGNVNAVEGYVELKDMTALTGKTLPVGTNASVDVTCNQAQNALLVPVEALHTTADGQSFVYVLNQVGTPEKRSVEVGLKTATTVEIRSGLQNGELVITSSVNLQ